MKVFPCSLVRLAACALIAFWLVGVQPAEAQNFRRRHKEKKDSAEQADDDATPAPKAAASPGTADKKQPDEKPDSADEAAPSKAPDSAAGNPAKNAAAGAAVSSIEASEIDGFEANPEPVRKLLTAALELTKRNLTYTFGSADPANGGMDCSGTIYYLLKQNGFGDVPRQSNEQYDWVRRKSRFYAVLSKKQDNFELREMRPGDLLFWTGTYRVDRDPPVTHVMVYLGKRKSDGHRLMFGSSDGRPYDGQRRNGVSVFDFKMPAAKSGDAADVATAAAPDHAPDFSGYGPVPGVPDLADAAGRQTTAAKGDAAAEEGTGAKAKKGNEDEAAAADTPKPKRSRVGKGRPRE